MATPEVLEKIQSLREVLSEKARELVRDSVPGDSVRNKFFPIGNDIAKPFFLRNFPQLGRTADSLEQLELGIIARGWQLEKAQINVVIRAAEPAKGKRSHQKRFAAIIDLSRNPQGEQENMFVQLEERVRVKNNKNRKIPLTQDIGWVDRRRATVDDLADFEKALTSVK